MIYIMRQMAKKKTKQWFFKISAMSILRGNPDSQQPRI